MSTVDFMDTDVAVLDPFAASAAMVADLHQRGRAALCHLRAGVFEPDRPDAARFSQTVVGLPVQAGAAVRWLDIRRHDALAPIISDRLALCVAKAFDGVVFSDVAAHHEPTGFPLREADYAAYRRVLLALAARAGLAAFTDAAPCAPPGRRWQRGHEYDERFMNGSR